MSEIETLGALELKTVSADGVFEAYASRFNEVDLGNDIVQAGAYTRTLKTRPAERVAMLWAHDQKRPIGVWLELKEDRRGLLARGRLTLDSTDGRDALAHIRAGSMSGLSIGYRATDTDHDQRGRRLLKAVELREISLVAIPMLDTARIGKTDDAPLEIASPCEWEAVRAGVEALELRVGIERARRALTS